MERVFFLFLLMLSAMPILNIGQTKISAQDITYVGLPCNINPSRSLEDINNNRSHAHSATNRNPNDDDDQYKEDDISPTYDCNGDYKVIAGIAGTVTKGNQSGGYGNYITIQSNNGVKVIYAHLNSFHSNLNDNYAEFGEEIGVIGCTGYCTGAHIHTEVFKNGVKLYASNHASHAGSTGLWEYGNVQVNVTSPVEGALYDGFKSPNESIRFSWEPLDRILAYGWRIYKYDDNGNKIILEEQPLYSEGLFTETQFTKKVSDLTQNSTENLYFQVRALTASSASETDWSREREFKVRYPKTQQNYLQGDINGDGVKDLIYGEPQPDNGNRVKWYVKLSGSNEEYSDKQLLANSFGLSTYKYFFIGDMNGDQKDDLITGYKSPTSGQLKWNVGLIADDLTIKTAIEWSSGFGYTNDHTIMSGDFNNDGITDLIRANIRTDDNLEWFVSLGNKNISRFDQQTLWKPILGRKTYTNFMVGNFVGDEADDLLVSLSLNDEENKNKNAWVAAEAISDEHSFGANFKVIGIFGYDDYHSFYLADITGDGYDDLIGAIKFADPSDSNSKKLKWIYAPAVKDSRKFGDIEVLIDVFGRPSYEAFFFQDYNLDSRADMIGLLKSGSRHIWITSETNEIVFDEDDGFVFNDPKEAIGIFGRDNYKYFMPADVDGDGRDDLIAGLKRSDGKLKWIMTKAKEDGSGFGSISTATEIFGRDTANYKHFMTGDLNGDGKSDLLTAVKQSNGSFNWKATKAKPDGSGFESSESLVANNFGYDNSTHKKFALADITGDGKDDLITGIEQTDNSVRWEYVEAKSDGTGFSATKKTAIDTFGSGSYNYFFIKDLNGDGYDDLIGAKRTSVTDNRLFWIYSLNNQNGQFGTIHTLTDTFGRDHSSYRMVTMADVNGDGKNDLIAGVTNQSTGKVKWIVSTIENLNTQENLAANKISPIKSWAEIFGRSEYDYFFLMDIDSDTTTNRKGLVAAGDTNNDSKYTWIYGNVLYKHVYMTNKGKNPLKFQEQITRLATEFVTDNIKFPMGGWGNSFLE